jgi:thymidine kinase
MKIAKKILSDSDKELLYDFMKTKVWDVFKKILDNDELNIMKAGMTANFDQEFFVNKGQILHIERLKSELGRIYKEQETKRNKNKAT